MNAANPTPRPEAPVYLFEALEEALADRGKRMPRALSLEGALRGAWAKARACYPGGTLSWDVLAAWLAERMDAAFLEESLAKLCVEDLYLAAGVAEGDTALEAHLDNLLAKIAEELSEGAPRQREVDRVMLGLARRLLKLDHNRPRIARYRGRGRLKSWLQADAARQLGKDDDTATLLSMAHARQRREGLAPAERDLVRRAFVAALATISSQDRTLLRRYYLEQRPLEEITPHDQTVVATRRVARAKRSLITATRKQLRARADLDDKQLGALVGILRGGLGVELGRSVLAREASRRAA